MGVCVYVGGVCVVCCVYGCVVVEMVVGYVDIHI